MNSFVVFEAAATTIQQQDHQNEEVKTIRGYSTIDSGPYKGTYLHTLSYRVIDGSPWGAGVEAQPVSFEIIKKRRALGGL
jgi:hypothetical protein